MRLRLIVAIAGAVAILVLAGDVKGQDPRVVANDSAVARQSWWVWSSIGVTDLDVDVSPPGHLLGLGGEFRMRRFLGVALDAYLGWIADSDTCVADGLTILCGGSRTTLEIIGAGRGYLFDYGGGKVFLSLGLGGQTLRSEKFGEIGYGAIFRTIDGLEVGMEVRRREGWSDGRASGTLFTFRVGGRLSGDSRWEDG